MLPRRFVNSYHIFGEGCCLHIHHSRFGLIWRWRQLLWIFVVSDRHGVMSQKTWIFNITAVRRSNYVTKRFLRHLNFSQGCCWKIVFWHFTLFCCTRSSRRFEASQCLHHQGQAVHLSIKDPSRTSQSSQHASIIKTNQWMLCKQSIVACLRIIRDT